MGNCALLKSVLPKKKESVVVKRRREEGEEESSGQKKNVDDVSCTQTATLVASAVNGRSYGCYALQLFTGLPYLG